MKYEMNMQTGKEDRLVIEVGDKFKHKWLEPAVTVIVTYVDLSISPARYAVKDLSGAEFCLSRTILLRDFEPYDIEDEINSWSPEKREEFNRCAQELLDKVKKLLEQGGSL